MFARDKGAAENVLRDLDFLRLHIFRPGCIHAVAKRREPNFGYRVMRALWPVVRVAYPNAGVASDVLAHAMTTVGLDGPDDVSYPDAVLENRDIRAIAAASASSPTR